MTANRSAELMALTMLMEKKPVCEECDMPAVGRFDVNHCGPNYVCGAHQDGMRQRLTKEYEYWHGYYSERAWGEFKDENLRHAKAYEEPPRWLDFSWSKHARRFATLLRGE